MISVPVLISVVGSVILFAETATARRCYLSQNDPRCSVEGHLPLQLNCDSPAKWFTVGIVSEKDVNGVWKQVGAPNKIADDRCKASRIEKQGDGSECTVDDIPGICAEDEVKVEFYCWDADPDQQK